MELDAQFADLQVKEQQWPLPGPDVTPLYKKHLTHTYKLGQNIVCACCGCISHGIRNSPRFLWPFAPFACAWRRQYPIRFFMRHRFSRSESYPHRQARNHTRQTHLFMPRMSQSPLQGPSTLRSTCEFPMGWTCSRRTPRFDLDRGTPDRSSACLRQHCSPRSTK